MARGIFGPKRIQAWARSSVPATRPPTRIGNKALLFLTCIGSNSVDDCSFHCYRSTDRFAISGQPAVIAVSTYGPSGNGGFPSAPSSYKVFAGELAQAEAARGSVVVGIERWELSPQREGARAGPECLGCSASPDYALVKDRFVLTAKCGSVAWPNGQKFSRPLS